MKSYYGDALDSDNNKKIIQETEDQDSEITEDSNGISDDVSNQSEYNFERYKDYKPEETQVCSNSLSRTAIITLMSIFGVVIVAVIIIIVANVTNGKSKASEYKDYNVKKEELSRKTPHSQRLQTAGSGGF